MDRAGKQNERCIRLPRVERAFGFIWPFWLWRKSGKRQCFSRSPSIRQSSAMTIKTQALSEAKTDITIPLQVMGEKDFFGLRLQIRN
jgi:hypothetical protein